MLRLLTASATVLALSCQPRKDNYRVLLAVLAIRAAQGSLFATVQPALCEQAIMLCVAGSLFPCHSLSIWQHFLHKIFPYFGWQLFFFTNLDLPYVYSVHLKAQLSLLYVLRSMYCLLPIVQYNTGYIVTYGQG